MLNRRAEELDARERALNAREANSRVEALAEEVPPDPRAPNWPPCFPKKLVFQDFELDIPLAVRSRVRMTYYHLFAVMILLLLNMLCGIVTFFSDIKRLGDLILSCFWVVVVTLLVFFTYRKLYDASRIGSSLSYGIFLVGMFFEFLFDLSAATGFSGSGFLGIWSGVLLLADDHKTAAAMNILNGCLWVLSFVFDIFLFIAVRKSFNDAGGLKAFRKQAVEESGKAVVGFIKDHPDQAKKAGKAAVSYARENPDVVREVGRTAVSAASESEPLLH